MAAREDILRRLRAHLRTASLPAPWQSRRHFPHLVERFCQALEEVGGEALVVQGEGAARERLHDLLGDLAAHRVVMNNEPPLNQWNLPQRWPEYHWFVVGQSDGDVRTFAASADVGISAALAALAETGTVVLGSGPGRSRLATLLPPVHIAIVPASIITVDMFTWVSQRPQPMPAALTFVTGPSKTADIEQTLITGVHGPRRIIAILII